MHTYTPYMLIPLDYLVQKYNVVMTGVLHVGAHECEEIPMYEQYLSRDKILWVEGMADKVAWAKNAFPGVRIEQAFVSDTETTLTFHRSNNGQSSSLLEFGLHRVFHPQVHYVDSYPVQTQVLRNILPKYADVPFNFINLDIQGVELKALRGMEEYLAPIQYIYTEVNSDYVYQDCALIGEIDAFLAPHGFRRVETAWAGECRWGDAFYVRV